MKIAAGADAEHVFIDMPTAGGKFVSSTGACPTKDFGPVGINVPFHGVVNSSHLALMTSSDVPAGDCTFTTHTMSCTLKVPYTSNLGTGYTYTSPNAINLTK